MYYFLFISLIFSWTVTFIFCLSNLIVYIFFSNVDVLQLNSTENIITINKGFWGNYLVAIRNMSKYNNVI